METGIFLDDDKKPQAVGELARLGYADPAKALANVRLLAEGIHDQPLLKTISAILRACPPTADPDGCLNGFERVSAASGSREGFLRTISSGRAAGSAGSAGIKLLAPIFASSRFLVRFICQSPDETLSWFLAPGRLDGPRDRELVLAELLALCPKDTPLPAAMS